MDRLMDRLSGILPDEDSPPETSIEGDSLVIDCRGCGLTPLPGSDECIRCMVDRMCETGGCDTVVLRTGRDMEISGKAGEAIRDVASVKRWSYSRTKTPLRCRGCPVSRESVMDSAWSMFPKGAVSEGRRTLGQEHPEKEGCDECILHTSAALDQMEEGIDRAIGSMRLYAEGLR